MAGCFRFCQAQVPSASTWLRADSADLNAAVWVDVSGNGFHATPSGGTLPSEFSLMNFNKCFDLSNGEYFSLPVEVNDSKQADVIVVYETYDSIAENALWQLRTDSAKRVGQTTQRILNDNGQMVYDSVNRMKPVINYLAQSWRNNGGRDARPRVSAEDGQNDGDMMTNVPTLTIGMADSLPLNGRIAEAVYFDHRISDTSVIQWISYLAVKYGITLAQTDYMDSRRNVIWDYSNYPEYAFSIAGLGRDDGMGLYQKQSYFADGQIIMGIGSLANTNEENPAIMADGDFLIMGMQTFDNEENAGDSIRGSDGTAPWPISTLYTQDGNTYEVIGRSMTQATGDVRTYNTFLRLDTNAVRDTVVPVLLIDRSGSGDFPAWATEQVRAVGIDSAGHYMYGNIHWDTDQNGRDAFCFAVNLPGEATTSRMATSADATNPIPLLSEGMAEGRGSRDARPRVPAEKKDQDLLGHNNEGHLTSAYRLFPNPNHGKFTVEMEYPDVRNVTLTMYAPDGRKIWVVEGKGQRAYRFEGQMETSGHYLIDIVSDRERKQLKMVVN